MRSHAHITSCGTWVPPNPGIAYYKYYLMRAVLNEEKKKKCSCTQVSQKCPRAHHVLAVGGWRLAIGDWQLMAVGGGWRQLVVGDWWLMAVSSGWRVAVGGSWRLAVGGGWWQLAVGGGWWLVVGG